MSYVRFTQNTTARMSADFIADPEISIDHSLFNYKNKYIVIKKKMTIIAGDTYLYSI